MSEQSIRKLRKKFILISMLAFIAVMFFMGAMLYAFNAIIQRHSVELALDYIIENEGEIDKDLNNDMAMHGGVVLDRKSNKFVRAMNDVFIAADLYSEAEFSYSVRYFAVLYDSDGNVSDIMTNHIAAVSDEQALEYAGRAKKSFFNFARDGSYYYKCSDYDDGSSIVVYLDSTGYVNNNDRILRIALLLLGFGIIATYIFVGVFSKRVVSTEVANAEIQKQFITNAGHELKTPLSVIRANTEMTEIESGESEWTKSTMRQIDRMNGLIQNLVKISRAEEGETGEIEKIDVSRLFTETADSYAPVAKSEGKELEKSIPENVTMFANESTIRQLATLLLDNAIKYCDDGGKVEVSLLQKGRGISFCVSNSYAEGENVDYSRFFERFYRQDESHNTDKGGYGIGLSIAESLVKQYNGTIDARWKDGIIYFDVNLRSIRL